MNCLILGGTGFLGEHLSQELLGKGYNVYVYSRTSLKLNVLRNKYPEIHYIEGDFIQENNFKNVIDNMDIVFHLISTTTPVNIDVKLDIESNVLSTIRFLEACKESTTLKKIIYFSSGGTVYGKPKVLPIPEEHNTSPISSYGVQKLFIEKYLYLYNQKYNIDYIILRIANPYGPGQYPYGNQGVIASFLAKALMDKPLEIWGDGSVVRDFIYVDDVMNAAICAIEYRGETKIFNIGNGNGMSLNEIIDEIQCLVETHVVVLKREGRQQDVPVNVLNIERAKVELAWKPCMSFKNGLLRMKNSWTNEKKIFEL
jgi:UDP-glucose 4-epimerase